MESLDRLPKNHQRRENGAFCPLHGFILYLGWGRIGVRCPILCLRLGSDLIDISSHLNHYCESMEFIFSNCSLTSSLNRDQIREGPLENLLGGGGAKYKKNNRAREN